MIPPPIKLPLQPYADDFIRAADDNSVLMLMPALRTRAGLTKEQVDELREYIILAVNEYEELAAACLALLVSVRERYSIPPEQVFDCEHMRRIEAVLKHGTTET